MFVFVVGLMIVFELVVAVGLGLFTYFGVSVVRLDYGLTFGLIFVGCMCFGVLWLAVGCCCVAVD